MGLGELASPSLLLFDFRLERRKRGGLPMRPHLAKRQSIRFAIEADEASQIGVPFVQPRRETSRAYSPCTFDIEKLSRQHVLRGFEYDAACSHYFRFVSAHSSISQAASI